MLGVEPSAKYITMGRNVEIPPELKLHGDDRSLKRLNNYCIPRTIVNIIIYVGTDLTPMHVVLA